MGHPLRHLRLIMYALLAGVTGGYQHVPFVLPAPVARTSSYFTPLLYSWGCAGALRMPPVSVSLALLDDTISYTTKTPSLPH